MKSWIQLCAWLSVIWPSFCFAQEEFEITIPTSLGDTTETFWLQIPAGYQAGEPCPLLIGWHQLYANHMEFKFATDFDSIANARNWIAASHDGPSPTHWNNQVAQSHVVDMIHWIEGHYSVDSSRIYMVGSSMGGAAGMIFSNNHLDPAGPMVAAVGSMSGIQDCERRFYEQGINNTMIGAFGGNPQQVPFEYHRNSAIYFADSTASMHFNALHLPLYLTFGNAWTDSVWRRHAEDLYAVMVQFADTVVLYESAQSGHGWGGCEEGLMADFLQNFTLNRYPLSISINADEEGNWYWANIQMRQPDSSFARFEGQVDTAGNFLHFAMLSNVANAALDMQSVGFPLNADQFFCQWDILDGSPAEIIFKLVPNAPFQVMKDGMNYAAWSYNPATQELTLQGEGSGLYEVIFNPSGLRHPRPAPYRGPVLSAHQGPGESLSYVTGAPGAMSWRLYDLLGRKVRGANLGWRQAGTGEILIDDEFPSGIYFLELRLEGTASARFMQKIAQIH